MSNVFVLVETPPGWLQAMVDVNPVTILVRAMRGLMHGGAATGDLALVLAVSAGPVAVFAPLTVRASDPRGGRRLHRRLAVPAAVKTPGGR